MGKNKVINKVPEAVRRLEKEVSEWTREGADLLTKEIDKLSREPKSGRKTGDHIASAPGEPFARLKGDLVRSLSKTEKLLSTTLGSNLEKAGVLEKGSKRRNKKGGQLVAPRPTWSVAIERIKPKLKENLLAACRRANLK